MIKNIIFDLSEVIISGYYGIEKLVEKTTEVTAEQFLQRKKLTMDIFFEAMRGNITENEYIKNLLNDNNINITVEQLKQIIRKNLNIPLEGTMDIIKKIKGKYNLILLSDHIKEWMEYIFEHNIELDIFDKKYFSYELGKIKSDAGTFKMVLDDLNIKAEETLFIDDSKMNIEVARANNLKTILFKNAKDLEEQLIELKILNHVKQITNYGQLFEDPTIVEIFNKLDKHNDNQFNHGLQHIMNVIKIMKNIIKLLEIKRPESDYLLIACVLHDIGQLEGSENHNIRSKEFAEKYLQNKIEPQWLNKIVDAIETHHQKEKMDELPLFNHLVLFADKMDFTKNRLEKNIKQDIFEKHINSVDIIIENSTLKILITSDKTINAKDFITKFEYSPKIISRIKQFAHKLKLNYEILLDNQKIEIKE